MTMLMMRHLSESAGNDTELRQFLSQADVFYTQILLFIYPRHLAIVYLILIKCNLYCY